MRRLIGIALVFALLAASLSRTVAPLPVHADPLPENTRKLLEKSLSVVEIDREIARIAKVQTKFEQEIGNSKSNLAEQEIAVAVQREQAGRVLRSIYIDRQQFWLTSALSARSLSDLLRVWEMMDIVVKSDRKRLNDYAERYRKLLKGYEQLRSDQQELSNVKSELLKQRERVADLQDEIDRALTASGEADHLRKWMDELTFYWENVGLYELKQHFRALAFAMKKLPGWVKKHPDVMETKGLKTKLTVTDEQLNEFLREQDRRFDSFDFRFETDLLVLEGDTGDMKVKIEGHYSVENEPVNAIQFHVDKLLFNGLELPDTTRADLEREFDLGFYPQKLIKFVKADSVELTRGKLIVQLKVG